MMKEGAECVSPAASAVTRSLTDTSTSVLAGDSPDNVPCTSPGDADNFTGPATGDISNTSASLSAGDTSHAPASPSLSSQPTSPPVYTPKMLTIPTRSDPLNSPTLHPGSRIAHMMKKVPDLDDSGPKCSSSSQLHNMEKEGKSSRSSSLRGVEKTSRSSSLKDDKISRSSSPGDKGGRIPEKFLKLDSTMMEHFHLNHVWLTECRSVHLLITSSLKR